MENKKLLKKISKTLKYTPITIRRCGDFAEAVKMALSIISVKLYYIDNISFY
ncbi:hypothetical protein Q2T46_15730 [Thermoanaerobacterium sp. CMT5567-10]|uniref:hypothetical protein n=1 Tax=Thermoanaerobacterium sp. CMT5567-10 TaxID=3061989 RepID=UPI00287F9295|nr:hypothetical protein [Thermoanaerobacterium sp. CMT5567-10]WLY85470.1 hypothetical protein Q2T46_15730 [Thermoanaerobacterium sp. CMT5567-10]